MRERAGMTQQQLAEKLGTSQRAIARWERDSVALRPDQLFVLADALGVSLDYLIGRSQERQPAAKGPPGKLRRAFERRTSSHATSRIRSSSSLKPTPTATLPKHLERQLRQLKKKRVGASARTPALHPHDHGHGWT